MSYYHYEYYFDGRVYFLEGVTMGFKPKWHSRATVGRHFGEAAVTEEGAGRAPSLDSTLAFDLQMRKQIT